MAIPTIYLPKRHWSVATKTSAMSARSYVATPQVAARTTTFQCCYCSTISISVSNSFRNYRFFICSKFPPFQYRRLDVSLPQLLSPPVLPPDFSVDSRHYLIVQQTFINCSLFFQQLVFLCEHLQPVTKIWLQTSSQKHVIFIKLV